MKHFLWILLFLSSAHTALQAQFKLPTAPVGGGTTRYIYGVRAGLNIARLSSPYAAGNSSKLGLMAGAYADNSLDKFISWRHEMTYSRQGFNFKNSNGSGRVDMQYLYAASLFTLNLGHLFQLHAGPQVGFLVNALADTVRHLDGSNVGNFFSITGQTRRLNYGGCAGFEVYPWKGLLLGLRYNLSFSSLNKEMLPIAFSINVPLPAVQKQATAPACVRKCCKLPAVGGGAYLMESKVLISYL
jgi:hypothetical protein